MNMAVKLTKTTYLVSEGREFNMAVTKLVVHISQLLENIFRRSIIIYNRLIWQLPSRIFYIYLPGT